MITNSKCFNLFYQLFKGFGFPRMVLECLMITFTLQVCIKLCVFYFFKTLKDQYMIPRQTQIPGLSLECAQLTIRYTLLQKCFFLSSTYQLLFTPKMWVGLCAQRFGVSWTYTCFVCVRAYTCFVCVLSIALVCIRAAVLLCSDVYLYSLTEFGSYTLSSPSPATILEPF